MTLPSWEQDGDEVNEAAGTRFVKSNVLQERPARWQGVPGENDEWRAKLMFNKEHSDFKMRQWIVRHKDTLERARKGQMSEEEAKNTYENIAMLYPGRAPGGIQALWKNHRKEYNKEGRFMRDYHTYTLYYNLYGHELLPDITQFTRTKSAGTFHVYYDEHMAYTPLNHQILQSAHDHEQEEHEFKLKKINLRRGQNDPTSNALGWYASWPTRKQFSNYQAEYWDGAHLEELKRGHIIAHKKQGNARYYQLAVKLFEEWFNEEGKEHSPTEQYTIGRELFIRPDDFIEICARYESEQQEEYDDETYKTTEEEDSSD